MPILPLASGPFGSVRPTPASRHCEPPPALPVRSPWLSTGACRHRGRPHTEAATWAQFWKRLKRDGGKLLSWLVDAVGIEPTTCRLRVAHRPKSQSCFQRLSRSGMDASERIRRSTVPRTVPCLVAEDSLQSRVQIRAFPPLHKAAAQRLRQIDVIGTLPIPAREGSMRGYSYRWSQTASSIGLHSTASSCQAHIFRR
jgi:hypothetical protein